MQFQRLRLQGFKSFVEPTEFRIEPGLTGIVGPNGCGKSNLLEALRWVMGANSAKAMRAGGMDDVIFAGSGNRPARNHADVTLTIDNADRTAPAQFNDDPVLEVVRRIGKDAGLSDKQFDACVNNEKALEAIYDRVEKNGREGEISGTPTFVINGVTFDGEPDVQGISAALDKALAGRK